eukprot:6212887-Pleurochrysis_carterae.AAC.8
MRERNLVACSAVCPHAVHGSVNRANQTRPRCSHSTEPRCCLPRARLEFTYELLWRYSGPSVDCVHASQVMGHAEMSEQAQHIADAWWMPLWREADIAVFNIGHHYRVLDSSYSSYWKLVCKPRAPVPQERGASNDQCSRDACLKSVCSLFHVKTTSAARVQLSEWAVSDCAA